ncbi:1-acyl-sn-glycerol-3-phosphate acyltransferase [Sabulilitoribacter arenilitoris]|uniref:1-acyl-sn-glycerol-3-phosphate acyltransferase n=1 Tax=Wocania arenilitoris TaxID=2044858 RepID=A0AAE3EPK3_9FLAO|nr:1-acyl-sn-glycerol-3-phosphate acyltransferase [Wocania arenilitoris]MCF7569300.1 1-acyl-sn-glycerol-3-phosphate acyltransferase [Wocania arenilitoris]
MKFIWLYSVRLYLSIGMFFYFRKIRIHSVKNVPKNVPVLLLSNHQNALLDALLIATKSGRFSYFLTRAAVFKKTFVSKILMSLQLLPVYRIRDGWSNLTNNNAIFETCSGLLNKNEAIVIFPEGSHNLKRIVRPLSKGFTRIVFDTLEQYPEIDLQLIPVGLNFENAEKFPDSTSIIFGEPIFAKSFVSENKNESIVKLKAKIQLEISKLTTHIPLDNYDETLEKLNALQVDFLNPKNVNNCIANNFKNCETNQKPKLKGIKSFFKGLLILNILLPYLVWKFVIKPKIDEVEFRSTFRFAVAITLVPFYLLILTFMLALFLSYQIAAIYLIAVLIISLLAVKL